VATRTLTQYIYRFHQVELQARLQSPLTLLRAEAPLTFRRSVKNCGASHDGVLYVFFPLKFSPWRSGDSRTARQQLHSRWLSWFAAPAAAVCYASSSEISLDSLTSTRLPCRDVIKALGERSYLCATRLGCCTYAIGVDI
jgi:hypothetical protein